MGERIESDWATTVVEAEEADKEAIRQLSKELAAERKRAEEEAVKRRAAERKVAQLQLQQSIAAEQQQPAYSVRIAGAEVGPILAWVLAIGGAWALWANWDVITSGGRRGAQGRWVHDRSLGGKKVWVPYNAPSRPGGDLPRMSDADFDKLTSIASAAREGAQSPSAPAEEVPEWWQPPPRQYASPETKSELQVEANKLLTRLEQAKNRGQDYDLLDILRLRSACQTGGGLSVEPRTVGGRDAIYRVACEAGIRSKAEPGSVDLGDMAPLQLAAGLAQDLQIPDARAARMLQGYVAAACRARIVDAITAQKQGDDLRSFESLLKMGSVLDGLPVLAPSGSEAELIAGELTQWADETVRTNLLTVSNQVIPSHTPLVARMLGFDPAAAAAKLKAA